MLHRFRHDERRVLGHEPGPLRETLAWLRREGFSLLSLDTLLARLASDGPPLERAVAFTIDDGYADHAEVAAPLFAEFDCPVTTFVVSGFLDGDLWLWWDRVEHAFLHTRRCDVTLALGGDVCQYTWSGANERRAAMADLVERLKQVPDAEKHAAIARLAQALDVDLPSRPPPQYAPMSWEDLRRAEQQGMRFGPHTVTHPVLSRTTDVESGREISESWRRLREEAASPQAIFCYPNGGWSDFGSREVHQLLQLGFSGAVVGVTGHATSRDLRRDSAAPFQVRRFAFPDDVTVAAQYAGGFERLKAILRGVA